MEKVVAVRAYLLERKRQTNRRIYWRCRQSIRRRRAFARRQARERLLFALVMVVVSNMQGPFVRTVWAKERSDHWWQQVVNSVFTAQDWLENFRMSHETFLFLCDKLRSTIAREDTMMRMAIPPEKRLALTLWFLATGADYRTIGHLFGVSKATVSLVTKDVCHAVVRVLLPEYIKVRTGDDLKAIISGFKNDHGFPQCAGVVDGTHIPIISPQECPSDYYNRKGWHSVIMQGTVDYRGQFVDVYVGWPGRVHDARVFANSTLFQRGQSRALFPNWVEQVGGQMIPIVVLGDPAYPLLPWLMKAYPNNGRLTREQKRFNYRLNRARVVVEHAYGRLKGRWRCLLKRLDVDVCDVSELVAACCVLHNVCERHGDRFNDEWMEGVDAYDGGSTSSSTAAVPQDISGVNIRKAFTAHFMTD